MCLYDKKISQFTHKTDRNRKAAVTAEGAQKEQICQLKSRRNYFWDFEMKLLEKPK